MARFNIGNALKGAVKSAAQFAGSPAGQALIKTGIAAASGAGFRRHRRRKSRGRGITAIGHGMRRRHRRHRR